MSVLFGLEMSGWGTPSHQLQHDKQHSPTLSFHRSPSLFPILDTSPGAPSTAPPSWQLDHLPSAPPPPLSPFGQNPLLVPPPEDELLESSVSANPEGLEAAVADFTTFAFLEPASSSPRPLGLGGDGSEGMEGLGGGLADEEEEEEEEEEDYEEEMEGGDPLDLDDLRVGGGQGDFDEVEHAFSPDPFPAIPLLLTIAPSEFAYSYERAHISDEEEREPSPPPRPEPRPLPPPPMRSFDPPPHSPVAAMTFIPALSRPRSAHLQQAYVNEDEALLEDDSDATTPYSISSRRRHSAPNPRKRSLPSSAIPPPPPPPPPLPPTPANELAPASYSLDVASPDALPTPPPITTRGRTTSRRKHLSSTTTTATTSRSTSSVSSTASTSAGRIASPGATDAYGAKLRRTEIPAVEDDPSIKPYGCCYPSCIELNRVRGEKAMRREEQARRRREGSESSDGSLSEESEEEGQGEEEEGEGETSYRTIRELRDHCAKHKKRGEASGETPFRCALDPCGKTFKSAAGLLWHFTSASAGHFFVSLEEGEDRPTKKFKATVEAHGRSEKCPITGCNKAFKQAAGLAYHLAHTANHPAQVTEALLEGFGVTLQSKTRWWFRKLGLKIDGVAGVEGLDGDEIE